ncbi:hypothetical protein WISP_142079 [Willisornis vidua]|uniref:Uncharacterized protein n=1 Tax=Willisornis vidua TaxID=1566151 RepID=A0ABQ9CLT3_9PASS|nr:hypothetical protein WISP_142079 [Willisornis vidua]
MGRGRSRSFNELPMAFDCFEEEAYILETGEFMHTFMHFNIIPEPINKRALPDEKNTVQSQKELNLYLSWCGIHYLLTGLMGTKFVILRHQTFDEARVTSHGANKVSLSAFVEGVETSVSIDFPEDEEHVGEVLDCGSSDLLVHGETEEARHEDEKMTAAAASQSSAWDRKIIPKMRLQEQKLKGDLKKGEAISTVLTCAVDAAILQSANAMPEQAVEPVDHVLGLGKQIDLAA